MNLLPVFAAAGLPVPEPEFPFHPVRKFRFDYAWVDHKLALEIDGGAYVQGRHVRGKGYEADCEKFAEALVLGWRILRVTPRQIESGQLLDWLERLLGKDAPCPPTP